MRSLRALSGLLMALLLGIVLADGATSQVAKEQPSKSASSQNIFLEKPLAFPTLVNPNCSHCIDEQKRRGSELKRSDKVLAWTRGKYDGGAIPVRFYLAPFPVISDTYGVFVYDHDAGMMRGFEPSLEFTFHGWRNGVMVMKHADGTLYSTLTGKAFAGPRKGDQLKPVATIPSEWGEWLDAYPGTVAYHMFDKYKAVELPTVTNIDGASTRPPLDRRLKADTIVIGIEWNGVVRAYPLDVIERAGGLVRDRIGDQNVVVLWNRTTQAAAIYEPVVELDEGDRAVQLEVVRPTTPEPDSQAKPIPSHFTDRETDSHWDITGRATSGDLKGKTLRWLPGVQCKWFAWAAEYPQTELFSNNERTQTQSPPQRGDQPFHSVLVTADQVNKDSLQDWRQAGYRGVVVVLDEQAESDAIREVATLVANSQMELHYWIEVARCRGLADKHPEWMASLGMHSDWRKRYPNVAQPVKDREVAKAWPWVPIGYREAFDAQFARVQALLRKTAEPYRGVLLNDLQGGPAACGCGNLMCRWGLDYGVPSTTERLAGDDVARRFVVGIEKSLPNKEVIPVWVSECEPDDLPADRRPENVSTGLCGSVPCATGRCPLEFGKQFRTLVSNNEQPIALLALQATFERNSSYYDQRNWYSLAINGVDAVQTTEKQPILARNRLWIVVEAAGVEANRRDELKTAALEQNPGGLLVALTKIDQSFEPRVIPIKP